MQRLQSTRVASGDSGVHVADGWRVVDVVAGLDGHAFSGLDDSRTRNPILCPSVDELSARP